MSKQGVKAAMIKGVQDRLTALGATAANISWPNVKFEPPAGIWFAVFYNEAGDRPVTQGVEGENELLGFVQIDVNIPSNTGEKAQTDALSALESYFVAGRYVSHSGHTAMIKNCDRSSGMTSGAYWVVSLTIYFYARYNRPALS